NKMAAMKRKDNAAAAAKLSSQLQTALQIARCRFRADLARQRLIVAPPVHEGHSQSARKLLVQYGVVEGLRTLDALQLAIALDLHRLEQIAVLVAADQRLCRGSYLGGCTAINPEQTCPPPMRALFGSRN